MQKFIDEVRENKDKKSTDFHLACKIASIISPEESYDATLNLLRDIDDPSENSESQELLQGVYSDIEEVIQNNMSREIEGNSFTIVMIKIRERFLELCKKFDISIRV